MQTKTCSDRRDTKYIDLDVLRQKRHKVYRLRRVKVGETKSIKTKTVEAGETQSIQTNNDIQ